MTNNPARLCRFATMLLVPALLNPLPLRCQELPKAAQEKLGALVVSAYQTATSGFPCKVKTRGKFHMIRWQDVDGCLNDAVNRIDWKALSEQIVPLRSSAQGLSPADFSAAVAAVFSSHALPFDKVLAVKQEDAYLPLTNSVLRYLPPDSLQDIPVIDKTGGEVGKFAGTYFSERTGGLASANTFRLALFQYQDKNGNMQSPTDKLLLDSFGVPWKDARVQPGFRLLTEKLTL